MPRRQVALFTEILDFDDSYSDLSWRAADSRARELDVDLVVCVGRRIGNADADDPAHNRVFRLALDRSWDGLVLAHIVYQHMSTTGREELARQIKGHRAAVTTLALGETPMVGFENGSGLTELINHLIVVHQKKRIVFVSGPMDIREARDRHDAWSGALSAAGLEHGPDWVVQADFNPLYCPNLVEDVVKKIREKDADAVVTSSDLVANALLRALPTYGIPVPDVAITGFDDIPLASQLDPGLTTVRQPIREQFRTALDWALGAPASDSQPTGSLVIRGSCGCPEEETGTVHSWRIHASEARQKTWSLRSRIAHLNLFAGRLDSLQGADALAALFAEWMPRLGVEGYALSFSCLADGTLQPWRGSDALVGGEVGWLRWGGSDPPLPAGHALVFPAPQMVPDPWWNSASRRTAVALPLVLGGAWYGIVLLEVGPEGNLMCRAIQELTASFLDREHRLKEEIRHSMEARVSTQLEAEKNRTLGVLVAGFSHDLATPFSVGQDSIQLLVDGLATVRRDLAAGTLSKSRLEDFLDQGSTVAGLLQSSWTRATDLVERFKRIGTEVPRDELRRVSLRPFLSDLLQSLQPLWRHRMVNVELDVDAAIEVKTRVSGLVDIVTNLVQNALVHAFPDHRPGKIQVRAFAEDKLCRLEFEDNGVGVAPEVIDRIFEPYVTTREGRGGTGLGLAVVRQRTQGLLGGTVVCERLSRGTRFVIVFPQTLTE